MRIIDITHPPQSLWIGREGENTFRPVSFECANWFSAYPNATIAAYYQPYGVSDPYPLVLVEDGTKRLWHPLLNELVKGDGELQIVLMQGETVGTSAIIPTKVDRSLISNADHPASESPSWAVEVVQDVTEQADRAKAAADRAEEAYDPAAIAGAVEDYLDEHPVSVEETDPTVPAWAKQPTKPTYTASEVGALPSTYFAPVQSVNGMTGNVVIPTGDPNAVLFTPQTLTDAQKEQARKNVEAAHADDVDALLSVVTGQSKVSTVEEVENTRAYAYGKVNYSASQGEKITVNVSGSAFSGSIATLYFWYAGAASHTSAGNITLGVDTDFTLSNDITAIEAYSADGGAGTVRFEITKTSGTSGGLVGAVSSLESNVSDLTDVIGLRGASTTVTHSGGSLTCSLDFSAESGETLGVFPSGTAFTDPNCYLYFRYDGDSGNTRIGAIPVGEETRLTVERAVQKVIVYVNSAASGEASLSVHVVGIKDDVDALVASANPLKGKKLNFLGDSITYGSGASHPFTYYLEQKYGCTCRNYGIAGSTVQYDENRNPMCVRYADMDDDADIVAVMGGTNDYWNNKPLGEMGDTANTTFYGALDIMIRGLIAKYPNALFYMVTPPHGDNGGNFDGSAKSNSGSMQDIANAVCDVASKYSIPVLDVFNAGGLYPSIADQKDIYYSDGVHLNTEGQKKLAAMHASFILSGGLLSGKSNGAKELPTVTASDNGKFLRVVSGTWAAESVPTAESNSFGGGS